MVASIVSLPLRGFGQGDEVVAQLQKEIDVCSVLRHPNVIRVFGSASRSLLHGSGMEVGMLMEYCPGESQRPRYLADSGFWNFDLSRAGCRCRVCCALRAVCGGVWLDVFVLDVSVRLRVWLYAPCASGYGAGGNLFDVLSERQCSRHPLPERGVVDMFLPTCRAVAYLHSLSPPVAHRDIKVCPLGGNAIACPACLLSIAGVVGCSAPGSSSVTLSRHYHRTC